MNNEFKKIIGVNETHYVLETASGGATSSGSIASVVGGAGKVQKRGNLLAQEENKEAPKPRNFVAKNAKMGGAGQHKDKKKAEKQGDVKHKKPFAEGEVVPLGKKHRGDLEDTHSCPKCGGDLQGGTYMGHRVKVCHPCSQVYLPPNSGIDQKGNKIGEQGVAEGSEQEKPIKKSDWFDPTDMRSPEKQKAAYLNHLAAQKKNKNIKEQGVAEGSPEDSKIGGRYTPAEFDAKLARIKARHQANPANPADLVARLQAAYKKQKPVAEQIGRAHV
jgi:hypothetical protein